MKIPILNSQKRLPVTAAALLAGVALAGLLSTFIEAPRAQHDFLHDHLRKIVTSAGDEWSASPEDLPDRDKIQIGQLITRFESPDFAAHNDNAVTGQALRAGLEAACTAPVKTCIVPVRLNRKLTVSHMNADLRVLNILETSLRIDFKARKDAEPAQLVGLSNEVRNLRFYQTQSGWVQNTAEQIAQTPFIIKERQNRFERRFKKNFVGLNYYPASASWKAFWTQFPITEIRNDIEKAKQMNVNAMRIFLTHDYFDAAESRHDALAKLTTFLDICQDNDIQVLVTLFDLRPDYTLSNWAADIEHADSVLSVISGHKALLAIDLKNQPDLDFENWGEGPVEGWLTVMARHIQKTYPNHPVTAGWSKAENAARLHDVFDLVTYHEYQNPKDFKTRLESIKSFIGDKPVMITEMGSTVWRPPFITSWTETAQAQRLSVQLSQSRKADGVFIWTLNDFEHVGHDVVGRLPWRKAQQKHFGLYRPDGSLRPAGAILKAFGATQHGLNAPKP